MTVTSCNDRSTAPHRVRDSRHSLPRNLARFAAWLTVGAVCLAALVVGTTAGLLYASGIFQ